MLKGSKPLQYATYRAILRGSRPDTHLTFSPLAKGTEPQFWNSFHGG